jgi:hypothetical protein
MPSREGPTVVRNGTHGLVKKGARNRLFPFSNDVGARAPGAHIGRVLEMAEEPADKYAYENKRAVRFGGPSGGWSVSCRRLRLFRPRQWIGAIHCGSPEDSVVKEADSGKAADAGRLSTGRGNGWGTSKKGRPCDWA